MTVLIENTRTFAVDDTGDPAEDETASETEIDYREYAAICGIRNAPSLAEEHEHERELTAEEREAEELWQVYGRATGVIRPFIR